MSAPAVVFVCGRNSVRSPMAEALWRKTFDPSASAVSCGVDPAAYPDGFMIAVMEEVGEDLSDFECREIEAAADDPVELVVGLAAEADAAASAFAERRDADYLFWPIDDPTTTRGDRTVKLEAYRAVREAIASQIAAFARESA